ncbi:high mobility group protein B1-like isoform X2 [Physella acuta]|nr:high mobility group protein B1-like isoform X2 [Physella acuta]XP_059157758.1 high mobility group protein B1-like isoform X2 [Physella acuta]
MGKKDSEGKPRGRMSSYAFFVQTCREEHKKKHPNDTVVFTEFTKKCAEKWKEMTPKEKKRFEDMAERDKARYEREMSSYVPSGGQSKKRKRTKDPNAPKRALSAFFFFCAEERPNVRAANPGIGVADVAKELGKKWEVCPNKSKFEQQAIEDKARYEREMQAYRGGGGGGGASAVPRASPKKAKVEDDDDEDDDDDDDDDE